MSAAQRFDSLASSAKLDSSLQTATPKLRKKVRTFSLGSFVEIYSSSHEQWFADGEVVDICWESDIRDNVPVPAGSSKITYGQGKYFQWVEIQRLHDTVR